MNIWRWTNRYNVYIALSISRGHFSPNKSRKIPIARPWGRGMGVFREFEVWPKFYHRNCAVCNDVSYCTAMYRESILASSPSVCKNLVNEALINERMSCVTYECKLCHTYWRHSTGICIKCGSHIKSKHELYKNHESYIAFTMHYPHHLWMDSILLYILHTFQRAAVYYMSTIVFQITGNSIVCWKLVQPGRQGWRNRKSILLALCEGNHRRPAF